MAQDSDILERRRQAYVSVFDTPNGEVVIADLARFCRASESTFDPDPRIAANLDGRREVFLRVQEHIQLSQEQLYRMKGL